MSARFMIIESGFDQSLGSKIPPRRSFESAQQADGTDRHPCPRGTRTALGAATHRSADVPTATPAFDRHALPSLRRHIGQSLI